MKYFNFKSLSVLSALAEAVVNVLRLFGVEIPVQVDGILAGAFGLGIRQAIQKVQDGK